MNSYGYYILEIRYNSERCCLKLHTVVWILNYGYYPKNIIDHIDRNKRNNLISNLEDCLQKDNNHNRGAASNAASHFRGVFFDKKMALKKWVARVYVNRKATPSGCFIDELEAAEYANKLLIENFGDVKNLYLNDISMGYTNKAYPNMPRHYEPEKVAA
jgi:hypothetical protein